MMIAGSVHKQQEAEQPMVGTPNSGTGDTLESAKGRARRSL
jgi:hypothetical protein